jgi:hypothetical protein
MSRPWAILLGCWMSHHGNAPLGGLLILQQLQCLRPSEALGLVGSALVSPEDYPLAGGSGLLLLAPGGKTKSGRPQTSMVTDPLALKLLRWFRRSVLPSDRLSSIRTLAQLSRWLKLATGAFNLQHIGWTPHSPRAGRASDMMMMGLSFLRIREAGRWQSDSSLRRYLDVMAVMGGEAARALSQYMPLIMQLEESFDLYFNWGTSGPEIVKPQQHQPQQPQQPIAA